MQGPHSYNMYYTPRFSFSILVAPETNKKMFSFPSFALKDPSRMSLLIFAYGKLVAQVFRAVRVIFSGKTAQSKGKAAMGLLLAGNGSE